MAELNSSQPSDDLPPTPPERRVRARLLDGSVIEYRDLQQGMIFQAVLADGQVIHPLDLEPDNDTFAMCDGPPRPSYHRGEGWEVLLWVGSYAGVKARSI